MNKSLVLVCDLDNTLANGLRRFEVAGNEPDRNDKDNYTKWLEAVQNAESLLADEPVLPVLLLLQELDRAGTPIIYLTSREERWRDISKAWLQRVKAPSGPLIMRPNGDWRSSGQFKGDILRAEQEKYANLEFLMLDDDPRGDVSPAMKQLGICMMRPNVCLMEE